jgi:signal transduction histidine kinase
MVEIRSTIGLLRSDEDGVAPRTPTPALDQLDELMSEARRAGIQVEMTISGEVRPLSATVSAAAYRIVQESLTNVLRHAQAHSVKVALRYEVAGLGISIADDGIGAQTEAQADSESMAQGGHGLRGMQERVAALGGTLSTGRQPGGGFLVEAWLPSPESHRDGEQCGASEGTSS